MTTQYQPKTGEACSCRPGIERNNCPQCEGTGQRIDFKAIRAKTETESYQEHAKRVLAKCGGSMSMVLSDTKAAPWNDDDPRYRPHYRVTLTGPGGRYQFDFWDSIQSGEKGEKPTEYDVIACLAWNTTELFPEYCKEFGYSEDSRRAHQCWKSCLAQTRALHRIFPSETAREALMEIQ